MRAISAVTELFVIDHLVRKKRLIIFTVDTIQQTHTRSSPLASLVDVGRVPLGYTRGSVYSAIWVR